MSKLNLRKAVLPILLALSAGAQAAKPSDWTEAELALVAPYCIDTMGWKYGDASSNTSPRASYWVSQMGKSFWAMHHYCVAILNLRRVHRFPSDQWSFRYHEVLDDLHYVVNNSTPDFVMLPEVYSRIGEVELLRGNPVAASEAFERARRQRPDYAPAYTHWVQALVKLGQRNEAMNLLREGLSHAPKSKPLLDLYRQLGGDPTNLPRAASTAALAASGASDAPPPEAAASSASTP